MIFICLMITFIHWVVLFSCSYHCSTFENISYVISFKKSMFLMALKSIVFFLLISTFKAYNNIFISLVFCILSAFILTTSYGGYYIDFHRILGAILTPKNSAMKRTPTCQHKNNLGFHSMILVFSFSFYISDFSKK